MRRFSVVLVVLAFALTGCGGSEHNDADVAFAQMMVPHHEQALEMVAMTKGHTLDPAVQDVVDGIEKAQKPEIAEMKGWLDDWGAHAHDHGDMGGMDHGSMDGMMSDADMKSLEGTADPAFQTLWLQMMVAHHEGALTMAKTEIADGSNLDAIKLAKSIVSSQTKEIATMKALAAAA